MELQWFEAVLYGLVAGITESLPISSEAHSAVLLKLFGCEQDIPVLRLFAHLGCLCGLVFVLRSHLSALQKQAALKKIPPRRRKRFPDPRYISELSLIKMAAVPVMIAMFFYSATVRWNNDLQLVAVFSALNGLLLLLPMLFPSGNKDARATSLLDRIVIGLSSFLSLLPGVSRVGCLNCAALLRGADRENAYRWSLLITIAGLATVILWDIYLAAVAGMSISIGIFFVSFLSGMTAFIGAYLAVTWARVLLEKTDICNFGYYSLGMALFAFILYLI